ncbi:MAG: hypothetical protein JWP87_4375, partial [Labilithrix sp.]|nr:hypothetical protein [Labilithrix sp.]
MRKPSLTVDTFVAALAVLGATAPLACSKVDRGAQAVPEPAAAASAAPPKEADPSPAPAAAPVAEPAAQAP